MKANIGRSQVTDILSQVSNRRMQKVPTQQGSPQMVSFLPFYTVLNIYEATRNLGVSTKDTNDETLTVQRTFCALATRIALFVWQDEFKENGKNFNAFINLFAYGIAHRYPNLSSLNEVEFSEIATYAELVGESSNEILEIWDRVSSMDISHLLSRPNGATDISSVRKESQQVA